jgi:hypothetical protein
MSLRIVSGVLSPKPGHQDNGSATIKLREHVVTGDATISGCEYGGSTDYDNEPCSAISIRAFDGQPIKIDLNGPDYSGLKTCYDNAKISWNCNGGEIKEITYFFAGEE